MIDFPNKGLLLSFLFWGAGVLFLFFFLFLLTSCRPDRRHEIIVSVADQKMVLLDQGVPQAYYPISTSKFGIGSEPHSNKTPLGKHVVARKIGGKAPLGMVFKNRRPTGDVVLPNTPSRDAIVTRILWLKGKEPRNRNSFGRYIYIHGTAEEKGLGQARSFGCVRMSSHDVAVLYNQVGLGATVIITEDSLKQYLAAHPFEDSIPPKNS